MAPTHCGLAPLPRTAMVTLEWSRIDSTTVVGRLKAPADIQLVIEAYSPYTDDFTGAYHISADGMKLSVIIPSMVISILRRILSSRPTGL